MSDELMELPEGWVQINLEEIVEILDNKRIPLNSDERAKRKGIYPYYGANGQVDTIDDYLFNGNHVLIAEDGGYFDNPTRDVAYRVTGRFWVNNHAHIVRGLGGITSRFLLYALNKVDWMQYVSGTTRLKLTQASLKKVSLLLPPLNEQKRIVAAIEALRERSQKARSALSAIPELCDKFRQSVLAAAFRGDLTADWRERNPDFGHLAQCPQTIEEFGRDKNKTERNRAERIKNEEWFFTLKEALPQEWLEVNFMDITWLITCGVAKKPDYVEDGVPFLSAQNAKPFKANLNDIRFISENDFKKFTVGGKPIKNDILYSRVGAKFGEAAKVVFDFDFAIYVSLTLIKPIHSLIDSDFLVAFLNSPYGITQARGGILGSGIQNLNVENVRHYRIPLPPIAEQQEISRRIDSLIRIVDSLEQTYQKLKHFLDLLDHAILAKAFRGELVEQDPNDEPASVLLERIRVDREQQMQGKIKKPGKKKRTGD